MSDWPKSEWKGGYAPPPTKCRVCKAGELMNGRHVCKACRSIQINRWRSLNTDRVWNARIQRKYGITHAEWKTMMDAQEGKCAICKESSDRKLHVDHCHESGRVRQLLCYHCNRGIGEFKDKPALLTAAIAYLKKHKSKCATT